MSELLHNIASQNEQMSPAATLSVEVIADFVCPFCFIGKRRLDNALKAVQGPSEVSWYPYQLNPEMPDEGLPFGTYIKQRFGGPAQIDPVLRFLEAQGNALGINFRFDLLRRVPNTLPLHQVMNLAETQGIDQSALADAMMSAFFEDGRDIGDREHLIDIAGSHGLSAADIRHALNSAALREGVLTREGQVRAGGLSGVPGFLLNRRLLVVGAQSIDNMINAFDRAMFGEGTDTMASPALH